MKTPKTPVSDLDRREFLKLGIIAGAALALNPARVLAAPAAGAAAPAADAPEVWVIHDPDPARLMQAALKIINQNGGFGKNVRKLALKVNAGWARTAEQGANTHPVLVDEFLAGCRRAGVGRVVMPEKTCDHYVKTFEMSGIKAAADKHKAELYPLDKQALFTKVSIPDGKKLTEALVAKDFLDADAVVNMPVAKHHGGARLTIAMKNWMGAVQDRGFWHKNNLHQCIADFSGFLKPTWTIVDATRIMLNRGPQGPGDMKKPDLVIVSRNQVCADAMAATLFDFVKTPADIGYLRIAAESGLGVIDPAQMKLHRVEAAAVLA